MRGPGCATDRCETHPVVATVPLRRSPTDPQVAARRGAMVNRFRPAGSTVMRWTLADPALHLGGVTIGGAAAMLASVALSLLLLAAPGPATLIALAGLAVAVVAAVTATLRSPARRPAEVRPTSGSPARSSQRCRGRLTAVRRQCRTARARSDLGAGGSDAHAYSLDQHRLRAGARQPG